MKQVVQSVRDGELKVIEVPRPTCGPTEVLVETTRSLVSSGTERSVRDLASAGLVAKARARPDLVRKVLDKARSDGLAATARSVRTRLDEDMALGYSASGVVLEVGEHVDGVSVGWRVATGGAPHAAVQVVAGRLAVPIPDGVTDAEAAFATVGAIALHGLRLAEVGPGGRVCVIGLGLIGQLAVRLARAAGCEVAGVDLREWAVESAARAGAFAQVEQGPDTTASILEWSRGRGVDAVLITAATASSDPVLRAPGLVRDRANIVVVGDVGLELERTPLYEKELTLRFARSYGPGRYDPTYEQLGIDYPVGHVRWTEGRNLEAVMDMVAAGRLRVDDLITHTFPIEEAAEAYGVIADPAAEYFGVQISYADDAAPDGRDPGRVPVAGRHRGDPGGWALVGAGTFARATLLPALDRAGITDRVAVASATGVTARQVAESGGFERVVGGLDEILDDQRIGTVVLATPHSTHAAMTVRSLEAGRHVLCEKPLALSRSELSEVATVWAAGDRTLMAGFNRRHSPMVRAAIETVAGGSGPLVMTYRVNAGALPADHWYLDRREGGRLLGEVCHFIDTCNAITGTVPCSVMAHASGPEELMLRQDLALLMSYDDGSLATITYASGGHARMPKERLEVLGRGHAVVIDDFATLTIDGSRARVGAGKGHVEELAAFVQAIRTGDASGAVEAIHTSEVALAAVESLRTGTSMRPSYPPEVAGD